MSEHVRIDDGNVWVFRDVRLHRVRRPTGGANFSYTAVRECDGREFAAEGNIIASDMWDGLLAVFGTTYPRGLNGKRWTFVGGAMPWKPEGGA